MVQEPFFIVGTQRSGTTLLFQILDNHPDLFVLNEIWHLYPFVRGETTDLRDLEELLISHLGLNGPYLGPDVLRPDDVFEHIEIAFNAKLRDLGKNRWAIKDPRLTYYLEDFQRRYPDSKWVMIIRDARGVVNSYLTRKWNVANVYSGARLWDEQIEIQRAFVRAHPEKTHVVHFEDLLANPRQVVTSICQFLGVECSEELLSYHRKKPSTPIHEGNVNITKPIQKAVGEKWRSRLSAVQIAVIETVAGKTLESEGYSLVGRSARLSVIRRYAYLLHQWVMTNYWWQKRSGWMGAKRRLGLSKRSRSPLQP